MSAAPLLVEVLAEELPPKALKKLGEAFAEGIVQGLERAALLAAGARAEGYATPRRLAVRIDAVLAQAPERRERIKLMPAAVGLLPDGGPSPALVKKLAGLGLQPADAARLERSSDGKAEALFWTSTVPGSSLAAGLQQALDDTLAKLPIPKLMSYQLADGWSTVQFVRPAHGLLALHGGAVVPLRAFGLQAGRSTRGHRFEGSRAPIELAHADDYAARLARDGAVIASFSARRADIERQLQAAAAALGLEPLSDDALLDEVTALVEWPQVLACSFERAFLDVPQECLILTMKANQKYFPLLEPGGRLSNRFLVVANIRPDDAARIVEGNERVVRPRLADAKFFFDQDRRKTLASRLPGLDRVVYHNKLGSQGERSARVVALARAVAERLAEALGAPELPALAERAARLAKADLLTDMVGEFPELQGTMGRYYALADGEPAAVAEAIEHHYRPRFAGDELAASPAGLALALADKLETLAGLFSIGERPSGDRDPFALRRHALGVLRMLIERDLPLELPWLIERALAPFSALAGVAPPSDLAAQLQVFFDDRLVAMLREQQWTAHEVDAVVAVRPPRLGDVPLRLQAVRAFAALPEAQALAAANKRIGNILKKSEEAPAAAGVDAALLQAPAEQALAAALGEVAPQAEALHAGRDYTAALRVLARLRPQVDAFFDQVMVNTDDAALRRNRLALLTALQRTMNRSAELARLAAG